MPLLIVFYSWLFGAFLTTGGVHPYHVSATEMEYLAKDKKVEISTRIFTDDFENVLAKLYKQKIDLADSRMKPQMTELIKKYITSHISLHTNSKHHALQFFGWEIEKEAVYIYTVANAPGFDAKNILIKNTVMYDLFDDQVNITHFIINSQRKSTKLTYPEEEAVIRF